MKRFLVILAISVPICISAQGFGSFSGDQPFFALTSTSGGTPDVNCNGQVFPTLTSGNIVARWDPNISGTNDGDLVVTLQDNWTNVYNLIATNGGTDRPMWTNSVSEINNLGYLHFNCTTGNIMRTNIPTAYNQPNVYFIVTKNVNSACASDSRIFCAADSNNPVWTYNAAGASWNWFSGSSLVWGAADSPPNSASWQVYIFRQNGASSSAKAGNWVGVSGNSGAGNGHGMVVAGAFDNSLKHNVDLGYFLWVNGNLSGTEETNVVRWIANCFGVPSNYGP